MKIENPTPLPSPRADLGPIGKSIPKDGGRAFGEAFANALGTSQPTAAKAASSEDHLKAIKLRMETGYYNTKSVTDALSEKLTGIFDELA